MNIRKLVASGILGATSLLTGCDAYNNTQRVFAREFGIAPSKQEQEAQAKALEAQRLEIERQKSMGSLDNLVNEVEGQEQASDKYAEAKDAYNGFIECNPEAEPLAVFPQFNKPVYAKHDVLIRKAVSKWNNHFKCVKGYVPLDPNFAKAVMLVESGGAALDRKGKVLEYSAFQFDPFQNANDTDVGTIETFTKRDDAHLIPGNAYLGTLQRTPRKNGKWDYTFTPMKGKHKITAVESVDEGIHLLCQKALKFTIVDKSGKLDVSFRGWDEGAERYNGGGDKEYNNKIHALLRSINPELK